MSRPPRPGLPRPGLPWPSPGGRRIAGSVTGRPLFVGEVPARKGRKTGRGLLTLRGAADCRRAFGPAAGAGEGGELGDAVRLFFANGGSEALVLPLSPAGAEDPAERYRAAFAAAAELAGSFDLLLLPPPDESGGLPPGVLPQAAELCRLAGALLLLDPPGGWSDAGTAETGRDAILAEIEPRGTALWFPRLRLGARSVGASGALAGLIARWDAAEGLWRAPAGARTELRGADALDLALSGPAAERLGLLGINPLRLLRGSLLVWGARTLAGEGEWKYLAVRRLALYLERSIREGTGWAAFEPSAGPLWSALRQEAGDFLHGLFGGGAFAGDRPDTAYFVRCDASTTTPADRAAGRANLWIGFAALRPAEFLVLRLAIATAS